MRRVLFWLVLLTISAGALVAAGLNRDNRKVQISFFYSGVDRLIWLANERKRGNARAS